MSQKGTWNHQGLLHHVVIHPPESHVMHSTVKTNHEDRTRWHVVCTCLCSHRRTYSIQWGSLSAKKDLETSFHRCGGPVKLMQARLSARKDLHFIWGNYCGIKIRFESSWQHVRPESKLCHIVRRTMLLFNLWAWQQFYVNINYPQQLLHNQNCHSELKVSKQALGVASGLICVNSM